MIRWKKLVYEGVNTLALLKREKSLEKTLQKLYTKKGAKRIVDALIEEGIIK